MPWLARIGFCVTRYHLCLTAVRFETAAFPLHLNTMRIERSSHKPGHTQQSMAALSAPVYSDLFHPWRYITGALGSGRLIGHAKRRLSRLLYEYLGRRYPQAEWTTMNYGYAATDQPGCDPQK